MTQFLSSQGSVIFRRSDIRLFVLRVADLQISFSDLTLRQHDNVIKCKHFPRYWPFVYSPATGEFPAQRAHYDVIVMDSD